MALRNAFENLATDATLVQLKDIAQAINTAAGGIRVAAEALNAKTASVNTGAVAGTVTAVIDQDSVDSLTYMLQAILEKMPSLTNRDLVRASIEDGSMNAISGPYFGVNNMSVGEATTGRLVYRMHEPWHFSNASSAGLYNQIQVT
jgi:hypothetical protein